MTTVGLDPRIGSELAGYRIERLLGRGGMSVVYLAEDLRLKRKVALKLLAPELAADERFRERFLRESELAASLDHPNVIPIYEAGEAEGVLYIAMRFVEGTDLKALLEREGRLEPRQALALVGQVAEALDTAHEHGLVHRDVKPGNVLLASLGGREHCYLSDFGLTKATSSDSGLTETGQFVGTADYVAPEQIDRRPVDGRADVYSLGCVLFECLTGQPPYKSDRLMATLWSHLNASPPRASEQDAGLPAGLDPVLARALAKEPAGRYATCRELVADAWHELGLTGELPQALAPPPPLVRRRTWLLAAVAAGLVVLAAVLAVVLSRDGEKGAAPAPILPVTTESLVRIDPETGEALAAIPLGRRPVGVAVGEGSVWVIDSDERSLSRIDPQGNRVVGTVSLSLVYEPPTSIAAGEGAVWTIFPSDVVRYDPATGSLSLSPGAEGAFSFPADLAVGADAVWVSAGATTRFNLPTISRLDPATAAIVASVSGQSLARGDSLSAIWPTVGEGGIWAASQQGRVARIDPATNAMSEPIDVSDALHGIAAGEGALWALNANDDSVLRIDPTTLRVTGTVRVGRSPTALAAGAGAVWVTSERDGTVTRIDPATFGGPATDVAVGLGGVWVTVDVQ